MRDDSYYDVASVCVNGHVVNSSTRDFPAHNAPFCPKCGSQTIAACPACSTEIRGYYNVAGVVAFGRHYRPPAFCYNCGESFPWTRSAIEAAGELADTLEALTDQQRMTAEPRCFDELW